MADRLVEIKASMADRVLHPTEREEVNWLIARVEELEDELQARDHMLDAMGRKYGFHLE